MKKLKPFTLRAFKANESRNNHTRNAVRLAETYGTAEDIALMKEIEAAHKKRGYIIEEEMKKRLVIYDKYCKLLFDNVDPESFKKPPKEIPAPKSIKTSSIFGGSMFGPNPNES